MSKSPDITERAGTQQASSEYMDPSAPKTGGEEILCEQWVEVFEESLDSPLSPLPAAIGQQDGSNGQRTGKRYVDILPSGQGYPWASGLGIWRWIFLPHWHSERLSNPLFLREYFWNASVFDSVDLFAAYWPWSLRYIETPSPHPSAGRSSAGAKLYSRSRGWPEVI
ncbi:hypothetical protein BOTBODRAFT_49078 [Botryobasidium botryosum FD-172 SS1]|uniref:Uncharacterized protein n=1 Tax=Botryobasidium botryosum (strain FD-172 SS1) TaxID=930990 RepID=A0A067LV26_BOTB1|nr:hypothetical protein BOTBODRAFT_49078 [Botryobasidium botryosum FD-172 SS1]